MPHLLIAGAIHESGIELIKTRKDFTYTYLPGNSDFSYKKHIKDADALVIRTQTLGREDIFSSEKLKMVSRHGVGYDAVDVAALTEKNIPLTIVGDVNSQSVAEQSMTLLLAAFKRVIKNDRAVRVGPWDYRNLLEPEEVNGKNLLILGYGRIGRRLAKMATAFGMHVFAYDPFIDSKQWSDGSVEKVDDLNMAITTADCISVNMPRVEKPIIGKKEFDRMKTGVVIVNTARGGIIKEEDLINALKNGKVGAAGLDVFENEPPLGKNPFYLLQQVILSPHVAGLSKESAAAMAVSSVKNAIDFFDGNLDMSLVVNKKI
jgi:D-3-phosphoglycerate dehydrogenase